MSKERALRVHIDQIPPEGKNVEFTLNRDSVNERVALVNESEQKNHVHPPAYVFGAEPAVQMRLDLEGSTVMINGRVEGKYTTCCARCAEDTEQEVDIPLELVLKPHSERSQVGAEEEDLNFGVYDGEMVECTNIAEEFLVLALPFSVVCKDNCKGLCCKCGKNLNLGDCGCQPEEQGIRG